MPHLCTPAPLQSTSDPNATQRGINTRLLLAQERYQKAQADRIANPCPATVAALYDASAELMDARREPMKSLAPFAPKRYAELNEGGM
jgi:hypothetical protein